MAMTSMILALGLKLGGAINAGSTNIYVYLGS